MTRRDRRQLTLFEETVDDVVLPAEVPAALEALSRRLPERLYLGTSSWSFPGWEGILYAGRYSESRLSRWGLRAYSRNPVLRAASIDRTYYAPMTSEQLREYALQVPDGFRFVVKAPELCTVERFPGHARYGSRAGERNPCFLNAEYAIQQAIEPFLHGLGAKGGLLLFQFPPQDLGGKGEFLERLGDFLSRLPGGALYSIEIRNSNVLREGYARLMQIPGVIPCLSIHPRLPPIDTQYTAIRASQATVLSVRWNLRRGLSYEAGRSRYSPFNRLVDEDPDTRRCLAKLCFDHPGPVFVIANNKAEGSAPLSLFKLAGEISNWRYNRG